ncbi:hypothetical protein C8J57DRAFT_1483559 [Mycena rebaudengoi]|nr:hypothetical protein C8J57DRAFT_1483559 [Mycena rebaudengoi]
MLDLCVHLCRRVPPYRGTAFASEPRERRVKKEVSTHTPGGAIRFAVESQYKRLERSCIRRTARIDWNLNNPYLADLNKGFKKLHEDGHSLNLNGQPPVPHYQMKESESRGICENNMKIAHRALKNGGIARCSRVSGGGWWRVQIATQRGLREPEGWLRRLQCRFQVTPQCAEPADETSFKASQSARCNTVVGQSELKMNESVDETVRRARVEGFMLTWFKRQLELSCIAAGNEVVLGRLSELEAVGQRFDQDGVYGCADTMEMIRIRIPTEFGSTEKAREIEWL